jgi:hypothetical protein
MSGGCKNSIQAVRWDLSVCMTVQQAETGLLERQKRAARLQKVTGKPFTFPPTTIGSALDIRGLWLGPRPEAKLS